MFTTLIWRTKLFLNRKDRLKRPQVIYSAQYGEVPERSNGAVSKTVVGSAYPGFESLPLRKYIIHQRDLPYR